MSTSRVGVVEISIFSFQINEEIIEALTNVESSWNGMHHCAYFLQWEPTLEGESSNQFSIELKYFIPTWPIDWFKNPIPTLDAFEEENIDNIYLTIKVDI